MITPNLVCITRSYIPGDSETGVLTIKVLAELDTTVADSDPIEAEVTSSSLFPSMVKLWPAVIGRVFFAREISGHRIGLGELAAEVATLGTATALEKYDQLAPVESSNVTRAVRCGKAAR